MARTFALQAKGRGFESHRLHSFDVKFVRNMGMATM